MATFNTRISLKYDTLANWEAKNPVLLAGEIALATISTSDSNPTQSTPPVVLAKVGDGSTAYKDLSYLSARSQDVYAWAKASSKPTYEAEEIGGIDDYIGDYVKNEMGISVDTDTQYTIQKVTDYQYKLMSKEKGDADFAAEVATIDIPKYDDSTLTANIKSLEDGINAICNGTDIDSFADVEAKIAEIQTAATNVRNDVDTLISEDAGKSVRAIANEELAAQLIAEDARDSLDTLEEIAAWIQSHPDDAAAMNKAIEALQAKVDTGDKNVSAYVADAISALSIGDCAKAADLTDLASRVDGVEERVEALETDTHTHDNKDVLDGITATEVSAWDAAEQNAKGYTDTEIGKLATVATTGNIADLVQGETDYIVFNCGTASTVI